MPYGRAALQAITRGISGSLAIFNGFGKPPPLRAMLQPAVGLLGQGRQQKNHRKLQTSTVPYSSGLERVR